MRGSQFGALLGPLRRIPTRCAHDVHSFQRREFNNVGRSIRVVQKIRPRKAIRLAAAGGTLGASVLFFTDEIKHGYAAAERTSRVISTLAVCMNE